MSYSTKEVQVTHTHSVRLIECNVCGLTAELKPLTPPDHPLAAIMGSGGFHAAGFENGSQFIRIGEKKNDSIDTCSACADGMEKSIKDYCAARRGTTPAVQPTMPTPEGTH